LVDIDSDRIGPDAHAPAARLDQVVGDPYSARGLLEAREQRVDIILGLEAEQVVVAKIPDQLRVMRQQPQHLEMRKRNVQEETDLASEVELAEIAREWNQVVVVHPYRAVGLDDPQQLARELR